MRLHTDKITSADIYAAALRIGVTIHDFEETGSKTRDHAFTLYLEGSSPRQSNGRSHKAATWDEWGAFMGWLYTVDPEAVWGSAAWGYQNAQDFHWKTANRFVDGVVPVDTHAQHKWVYDSQNSKPLSDIAEHYCNKCSARTRR